MAKSKFSFTNVDLSKCPLSKWKGAKKRCHWCNKELVGRQSRWCTRRCSYRAIEQHVWSFARNAALARDLVMCTKCGSRDKLEVNHITPIYGKHSEPGCWHHLNGLETLCHACHLKETKRQRDLGLFDKSLREYR